METITAQAVFDQIVEHLFTQGEPAVNSGSGCQYRGENGLKCAVGCLIPDDRYNTKIEGFNVSHETVRAALPKPYREHEDLMFDLQEVHDSAIYEPWDAPDSAWESPEAMYARVAQVAENYELEHEHFKGRGFGPCLQ